MQYVEPTGNLRSTRELAKYLQEVSQGTYFAYEFEDMLNVFSFALGQALSAGKEVRLQNVCTFLTKEYPGRWTSLGTKEDPWYVPRHNRIRVRMHPQLRKDCKKKSAEIYRKQEEAEKQEGESNAE